jgi:lipid A 3-O-deacylase
VRSSIAIFLLLQLPAAVNAQANASMLVPGYSLPVKYFRLVYENDVFNATDRYYTQGVSAELVTPGIKRFPLTKLLVNPRLTHTSYGVAVEHDAYTPTSISSDSILFGDRPYAATLVTRVFLQATDSIRQLKFRSAFTAGVIGPAAGGKEMQTEIHRFTGNRLPYGWQYQVSNDLILNYQLLIDKRLLAYHDFAFNINAMAEVGTLSTRADAGLSILVGLFNRSTRNNRRLDLYAYSSPTLHAIAYNATLQGGLIDRRSPYTIVANDMERIVFQNHAGIVAVYRQLRLECTQSVISSEFRSGKWHRWGGVEFTWMW